MSKLNVLVLSVLVGCLGLPKARADVIYTYTGNNFNFFVGAGFNLTTSDSVDAHISLPNALASNLDNINESANVGSWSITDGFRTLSSAAGDLIPEANFSTDSSGTITDWYFAGCTQTGMICDSKTEINSDSGSGFEGFIGDYTKGFDESSMCCNNAGFAVNVEGKWSVTSSITPEPKTLLLILFGLPLALFARRRAHS